jgi:TonB family protein
VALHGLLLALLAGWGWWSVTTDAFGDPNAGLSTVGVTAVAEIPLPSRGPKNPVATDTESDVPQAAPEKPVPKEAPEPDPDDAVALLAPEKNSKQPARPKLKSFEEIAQNQLTSKAPQALSSPMMQAQGGSQVNTGGDTTLGNRFPAYAAQIKEITRVKWRVQDVEQTVKTAPPVTVRFDLMKDGRATNVRLVRRSGVASLDQTVVAAVEEARYPPLPDGFGKDSVPVEFTFELRR